MSFVILLCPHDPYETHIITDEHGHNMVFETESDAREWIKINIHYSWHTKIIDTNET